MKDGIPYRHIDTTKEHECVVTEIFDGISGTFYIVNFYNPCKALTNEMLQSIFRKSHREIWCGDFN